MPKNYLSGYWTGNTVEAFGREGEFIAITEETSPGINIPVTVWQNLDEKAPNEWHIAHGDTELTVTEVHEVE